jgi:pimeloyl-ACP methyl ester carboxylesterase
MDAKEDKSKDPGSRAIGLLRRIVKWLRSKLKHLTIGTALIILVVIGFFAWLSLYFYVGDDLILDLNVEQTSFHITNVDTAQARVDVKATGQLFCMTECRIALMDAGSRDITVESFNLSRDGERTFTYALEPGRVGSGQSLYSVVASCRNVKSLLCPTLAPDRRKTALLTVNYRLAADEEQVKPLLRSQIESMLIALREADTHLLTINGIIGENPRLHAGSLLANITVLQQQHTDTNLFLEGARLLWADQSYLSLAALMDEANVTNQSVSRLADASAAVEREILALPATHNGLRDRVAAARAWTGAVLLRHAAISADPALAAVIGDALVSADNATIMYASDRFLSYSHLAQAAADVERNITMLDTAMASRLVAVVASGNALVTQERMAACMGNVSCNLSGVVPASYANLTSVCDDLNMSVQPGVDTTDFLALYCVDRTPPSPVMTNLAPLILTMPNVTSSIDVVLQDHAQLCCVFGECRSCCNTAACKSDPSTYPVLFVHGHAFNSFNSPEYSLGGYFTKIQQRLQKDGYVDAGILTPTSSVSEVEPGEWGLSGRPVTARVTYYYNFYRSGEDYIIVTQKSENIETYALRLNEIINLVKHHTGKEKVDIVAHSMGGLVVRRYMQLFGEESIGTVIMVGTPNHGITDRTLRLCPVFGESKECTDMSQGSVFMRKINDPSNVPAVRMVTIAGKGCAVGTEDGDGVVAASSVPLDTAVNHEVEGVCDDFFKSELHTEMLNIDRYPQVYEFIREELAR